LALFSRSKGVVGLVIGSFALKLVELQQHKMRRSFALQCLGIEPLSPGAIVDGSIMDSSLVVEAIEKLSLETRVKNPQFATSLSGHSVIIKKIELPTMSPRSSRSRSSGRPSSTSRSTSTTSGMDYVLLSEPEAPAATRWRSCWSRSSATR
jgi:Tfp pilus assembly PilM family ATPase